MNDFFSYDGPFFSVLNRLSDLVILNLLWFLCCLPVVTIGASTTALYYVTMKIVNDEDAYVAKNFFKSFKENFFQSTIIWIIMVALGVFIYFDFYYIGGVVNPDGSLYTVLFSGLCFISLVSLMVLVWVFPLQAKLENKIRHTFKNAVLLGFRHLPTTLALIAILVGSLWFATTFKSIFVIWVVISVAAIVYGCSFMVDRIFKIYIKPEFPEVDEEIEEE